MIKSLYIHIPFCSSICIYCDFYKMIAKEDKINNYIDYLIKEMELHYQKDNNIYSDLETIYIGGGTPSIIKPVILKKLFDKLRYYIDLSKIKEFTFECNPKDVNIDLIKLFNEFNVNRVSLGVQSLNNEKLEFLGRNHKDIDCFNAIKLLQENNINNISCDIIYGLENDNLISIINDVKKLIDLKIKHLSCYTLIIENKTILKNMIEKRNYKPLSDDKEADIYEGLTKYLESYGYYQYEISNYSILGYASKHNYTYWQNDNYLGLGAGASYFIGNIRYKNIDNLNKYYLGIDQKKLIYSEMDYIDEESDMFNEIMLNLRTVRGINLARFEQKYHKSFLELKNVNKLINKGLLINKDGFAYIKKDKLYIANSIICEIEL